MFAGHHSFGRQASMMARRRSAADNALRSKSSEREIELAVGRIPSTALILSNAWRPIVKPFGRSFDAGCIFLLAIFRYQHEFSGSRIRPANLPQPLRGRARKMALSLRKRGGAMRILVLSTLLVLGASAGSAVTSRDSRFDDPMFRRCVNWMLDGQRGAMIQNVCLDEYQIPPPSLFLCARKVRTGFQSPTDREACALIFEDQARMVRAGYIK
jgi:hypothetical protein